MLQSIRLKNFKCFDALELAFAPLTLLCGMNGMGKSSILQALLVLRQSASSGELGKGRLVLGGELADLGTGQDVLFEGAEEDVVAFDLRDDHASEPCRLSFSYSRSADQLSASNESVDFPSREWQHIPPLGGHVFYVSADRLGPRKIYDRSEVLARQRKLGTRGEYAWNYLYAQQNEMMAITDPRCPSSNAGRKVLDVVNFWLQAITPGANIGLDEVRQADALVAGFSFERPGDIRTLRYRATNVGFGLSYTLRVPVPARKSRSAFAPAGTDEVGRTRRSSRARRCASDCRNAQRPLHRWCSHSRSGEAYSTGSDRIPLLCSRRCTDSGVFAASKCWWPALGVATGVL